MSVDVESLTMPDFLALLQYEGNPPPGPEFDNIRMTHEEWLEMFPHADDQPEESDDGAEVPTAEPAPAPD
jgi:hypothetical protein